MLTDLRYALRTLAARPGFTATVVLTLGLGIGASTAIFSAVNGLLLRQPPFAEPDRLVRISAVRGGEAGPLAVPEFDDLRALPVLADAAMYTEQAKYNASGFGAPEELAATIANHNLFRVLGVAPLVGDTFPAALDRTRGFGLVISHGLWERKYGRDPNVVGRSMTLDGAGGYTIHGVMPPGFDFPASSDLFRSSGISPVPASYQRRDLRSMLVIARLRDDVSLAQARDAVAALGRRLEQEFPATNGGLSFQVTPLADMYSGAIRPYVLLLSAAAGLQLLIACANVANLLLSRAVAQSRELAVRTALGAGRARLVRQVLTESVVLSVLGGLLGVPVALAGVRLFRRLVPVALPPWMQVDVDGPVLLFLAAVTAASAAAVGLVPALRRWDGALHAHLKDGARGSSGGTGQPRVRNALVVSEVALALVLLVGATLLLQTMVRLQQVPLGFRTAQVLTFQVELGWASHGTLDKMTAFHRQVLERLRALPGVEAITFDNNLPMSGKPRDPHPIRLFGQAPDEEAGNPFINQHLVGPDYFPVMGIPLRAGRGFTDDDRPDTARVAVVSRRLAERLWPGRDAIGQRLQLGDTGSPDVWLTVVGVSEPVLHHALDGDPGLDLYQPYTQVGTAGPWYVIRTRTPPETVVRAATAVIGAVDPNQSFLDVLTYDERIAHRMWQRRLAGALFAGFAGLALLLAAIGLYGVLSHVVSQQRREIGVRVALGAEPGSVRWLVVGRGLRLTAAGVALGLSAAWAGAGALERVLFDVPPRDPWTFAGVPLVLLSVAALACYLPARRATRIDPLEALRAE
jgi:predicted permease